MLHKERVMTCLTHDSTSFDDECLHCRIEALEAENQRMVDETAQTLLKDEVIQAAIRQQEQWMSLCESLKAKLARVEVLDRYVYTIDGITTVDRARYDVSNKEVFPRYVLDNDLQQALEQDDDDSR